MRIHSWDAILIMLDGMNPFFGIPSFFFLVVGDNIAVRQSQDVTN